MKAIVITKFADEPVLQFKEIGNLEAQADEVKVEVKAIGVNQADLLQAKGKYPVPAGYPQDIPGLEFAGVINQIGSKVEKFKIGDRVFGLTAGGAYAQELTINAQCITKLPEIISFTEAAAIPEAFITAYDALITQMGLSMGETVLISAIGSGVGLAALQIAKHLGATVIGTSRSSDKIRAAESFGLDHGLLVQENKFSQAVKGICSSVDVVLELVGGNYINEDIDCVSIEGRIILVGLLAGRTANIDLAKILSKRLLLKGTTLRSRPFVQKILANKILEHNILPLLKAEKLQAVIDEVFPLSEAAQALKYLASAKNFGKVILTCD